MDLITKNPGLQHIAEEIFSNLDRNSLCKCQKVNNHWWNIIMNPWFSFNRIKLHNKLLLGNQKEWMKFCEKLGKLNLTKAMTPALTYIYVQLEDSMTLNETYWSAITTMEDLSATKIVRIMAPLIDNPNAPNK